MILIERSQESLLPLILLCDELLQGDVLLFIILVAKTSYFDLTQSVSHPNLLPAPPATYPA